MPIKAKRRIHRFNFDQEKMQSGALTHVALVDAAANLTEALTLKASSTTTSTLTNTSYRDDGSYSREENTVEVNDWGEDMVLVTNRYYVVKEDYVKIR